jgi:Uma2 family endonuclease
MATISTSTMTAEEFHDWVQRPENRDRFFELERGGVVEMPPPGKYHGFVSGNIIGILRNFAVARKAGYVCGNDAGIQVDSDPDSVRGPDVSFYLDEQTAETMERKYAVAPPPLVVEVLSPNDQQSRTTRRVGQFLKHGVSLVWVVDPEVRCVSVYRADHYPIVVDENEEIHGGEVLPDFRCRVSEFFAMPGR